MSAGDRPAEEWTPAALDRLAEAVAEAPVCAVSVDSDPCVAPVTHWVEYTGPCGHEHGELLCRGHAVILTQRSGRLGLTSLVVTQL